MSEHEFDIYLKLLAKMLRLSDTQRHAIADELRDHLETRLEELTANGTHRNTAIQQALEEFGDAAGLANQLTRIAHTRTRRRIMRYSITSAAATILIALFVTAVLPDGLSNNTAQSVSAQQDGTASSAPTTADPFGSGDGYITSTADAAEPEAERNATARAALQKRTPVDFDDTPLNEAIRHLSDTADIDIIVTYWPVDPATTINLELRDAAVATTLDLLLEQANAADETTVTFRDGIVMIVNADSADNSPEVRMYNIRDLLGSLTHQSAEMGYGMSPGEPAPGSGAGMMDGSAMMAAGAPGGMSSGAAGMGGMAPGYGMAGEFEGSNIDHFAAEDLIRAIRTILNEGQFSTYSEYSIFHLNGVLMVNTSPQMHHHIEQFLAQYRRALHAQDGWGMGESGF